MMTSQLDRIETMLIKLEEEVRSIRDELAEFRAQPTDWEKIERAWLERLKSRSQTADPDTSK